MTVPIIDYSSFYFSNPLLLLSLLVIPLYFLWKYFYLKKSRNLVVEFTGFDILQDMQNSRRRNKKGILILLTSVLLGVALANPVVPITTEEETANVMLVVDVSGSMKSTDVPPDRLQVAQESAEDFIANLPASWKTGLVAFSEQPIVLSAPTFDKNDVITKLNSLRPDRGTATGDAVWAAIDVGRAGSAERLEEAYALGDSLADPSQTVIVLLSDGAQTGGLVPLPEAVSRAQRLSIPIYTIALGTDSGQVDVLDETGELITLDVPPDKQAMMDAAAATGGMYFEAEDLSDLQDVYDTVGGVLEPISSDFYLAGLLTFVSFILLLAYALLALKTPSGKI